MMPRACGKLSAFVLDLCEKEDECPDEDATALVVRRKLDGSRGSYSSSSSANDSET